METQKAIIAVLIFLVTFSLGYKSTSSYLENKNHTKERISELENQVATLAQSVKNIESNVKSENQNLKSELDKKTQEQSRVQEKLSSIENTLKKPDSAKAIATWRSHVGQMNCIFDNGSQSRATGVLVSVKSSSYTGVAIMSNKHVMADNVSTPALMCITEFPQLKVTVTGWRRYGEIEISSTGYDAGFIHIPKAPDVILNTFTASTKLCTTKAEIGAPIVIIGYPVNGARDDVTATEGIVSGYDGNYYITSAKVEQGNSGGIAVNVKENCMLGIPTFSNRGTLESLARILDVRVLGI